MNRKKRREREQKLKNLEMLSEYKRERERERERERRVREEILLLFDFSPREEWADPGGTAIPGQPVARAEQAPDISPLTKNQFNIVVPM